MPAPPSDAIARHPSSVRASHCTGPEPDGSRRGPVRNRRSSASRSAAVPRRSPRAPPPRWHRASRTWLCRPLTGCELSSDLRPLAVAFPDPDMEWELDLLVQPFRDELCDVLDRRVLEERVPVLVIIIREDRAEVLLQVREVEEHAAFVVPLDVDVDLVGVHVEGTAALVARKVMGAVDVFRDPELHRFRPKVRAAIKVGLRALDRRDGEEFQRPLASLQELVFLVRLNEQYDPRSQSEFLPADDGYAAPFRADELVIPFVTVRGRVAAFRDDQLVHCGLPGPVLVPDELFHLHVVTAFLQESDRGDRPDVGRIHAGQRGNSRGPLTFLRGRSRMNGSMVPHASARHEECGDSQCAEEGTPNQD